MGLKSSLRSNGGGIVAICRSLLIKIIIAYENCKILTSVRVIIETDILIIFFKKIIKVITFAGVLRMKDQL